MEQNLNIDKYRNSDGQYGFPNLEVYETAVDFIQGAVIGFCLCGDPESSLSYIRDVLQHIENLTNREKINLSYDEWVEQGKKLFSSTGVEYFTYYVLSDRDLIEHGGSVPGWLSGRGRELLEDLKKLNIDEDELLWKCPACQWVGPIGQVGLAMPCSWGSGRPLSYSCPQCREMTPAK